MSVAGAPSLLQHPLAAFDAHHHPGARIESQVVGLAHVDDAVGDGQVLRRLERGPQRAPEFDGAGLRRLECDRNRVRELEKRLVQSAEWEKKPAGTDLVPKGLERPSQDLETMHGPQLDAAQLTSAQREQQELSAFHLERGRRFFEAEHDRDALIELRKAIYLSPYAAEPHLLMGRVLLRTGQVKDAIDALRIAVWSQDSAAGRVALAEALLQSEDKAGARAEATKALALDPSLAEAKALLARIDKP